MIYCPLTYLTEGWQKKSGFLCTGIMIHGLHLGCRAERYPHQYNRTSVPSSRWCPERMGPDTFSTSALLPAYPASQRYVNYFESTWMKGWSNCGTAVIAHCEENQEPITFPRVGITHFVSLLLWRIRLSGRASTWSSSSSLRLTWAWCIRMRDNWMSSRKDGGDRRRRQRWNVM